MLALEMWEAGLCRRCGQHLQQAMDPLHDPERPDADRVWAADGPDECHACKVLTRADRAFAKGDPDSAAWVVHTPVLRTNPNRRPRLA